MKNKKRNMYTMPMVPMMPTPMYPYGNPNGVMSPAPIDEPPEEVRPPAPPVFDTNFIQGWLRTQIGKFMRVDFLIGDTFIDKEGVLLKVGIDHIVLKETRTDSTITADLYSIKFVDVPQ